MKTLLLTLLLTITSIPLFGQNTERVIESFKQEMNDPSSFELINIEHYETVTWNDNIEFRIELFTEWSSPASYRTDESVQRYSNILEDIKELQTKMGDTVHETAGYRFLLEYRGKNKFGGLVKSSVMVETDNEYNVLNIARSPSESLTTLNGFPGYTEIIEKY